MFAKDKYITYNIVVFRFELVIFTNKINLKAIHRGASAPSNPADAHNVSFLGLCGRDICPKSYA